MNISQNIESLYCDWLDWSNEADKTEDGWESDFPKWDDLIESCKKIMFHNLEDIDFETLSKCWEVSHETEDFINFSKNNIDRIRPVLHRLSESIHKNTRWQVFEVLSVGDNRDLPILEKGLVDSDNYCKRRAILSISRHNFEVDDKLIEEFSKDKDPYIRLASIQLLKNLKDFKLKKEVISRLSIDSEKFIQKAISEFKKNDELFK